MANPNKITKREKFEMLKEIADVKANPILTEFIEHELELLAKKNSTDKKPTAVQKATDDLKEQILEDMANEPNKLFTISEMLKSFECCKDLSLPKVTALVTQLVKNGKVERVEEKRKAYFKIA